MCLLCGGCWCQPTGVTLGCYLSPGLFALVHTAPDYLPSPGVQGMVTALCPQFSRGAGLTSEQQMPNRHIDGAPYIFPLVNPPNSSVFIYQSRCQDLYFFSTCTYYTYVTTLWNPAMKTENRVFCDGQWSDYLDMNIDTLFMPNKNCG